jgi:hypothetical protein
MAEPVSERAHYLMGGDTGGRADLFLCVGPPSRPGGGFFRAVASVLIVLL